MNYVGIIAAYQYQHTLANIYDMMLCDCLFKRCKFDKCQAGGQQSRGCIGQIMTLRLSIDYVMESKSKLYVLFIDFSKTYDRVDLRKTMDILKGMGCGRVMLLAIIMLCRRTQLILKSAIIIANQGVRQGASTSSVLFILYMDKMVQMVISINEDDGFLAKLHTPVFMDETVIMACSGDMCTKKMEKVLEYCKEYGMDINVKKHHFRYQ